MLGLYLHIPFCRQRCLYCDFITYAGREDFIPAYVKALRDEILFVGQNLAQPRPPVGSVYFGGGTPSLLQPAQVELLLEAVGSNFSLDPQAEITLEANPGTDRPGFWRDLRSAGINRLSLGVQSFQDADLRALSRIHSAAQAQESILRAQQAGFDNISIDLIFGLPGQTLEGWSSNLKRAYALGTQHLSLYALILEEGTPLEKLVQAGKVQLPSDDSTADMFQMAIDAAHAAGWDHYEISNFAREQRYEARHNKLYWLNDSYYGFGVGAYGCVDGFRTANVTTIPEYIQRMSAPTEKPLLPQTPATLEMNEISNLTAMQETMMMGLRLTREGVSMPAFTSKFGCSPQEVFPAQIRKLTQRQLLETVMMVDGEHIRLTAGGIMLGNQAFMEFV